MNHQGTLEDRLTFQMFTQMDLSLVLCKNLDRKMYIEANCFANKLFQLLVYKVLLASAARKYTQQ